MYQSISIILYAYYQGQINSSLHAILMLDF